MISDSFIEKYFNQALQSFLDYQRQVEEQIRRAHGLPSVFPTVSAWTKAMWEPFASALSAPGGIGPTPPSWRDNITGRAYLISIRKDQINEEHSAIMQPDMSVPGRSLTVRVLGIGKPCYVRTSR